jgi:hypothetical protein
VWEAILTLSRCTCELDLLHTSLGFMLCKSLSCLHCLMRAREFSQRGCVLTRLAEPLRPSISLQQDGWWLGGGGDCNTESPHR